MDRLKGKVALVTGAASGIGRASAIALAREGAAVVLTDIDTAGCEAATAEIEATGGAALWLHQDVTDEVRWGEVVAAARAAFGTLTTTVNNAAMGGSALLADMSLDQWRAMLRVNLESVFLGVRASIRAMRETGGGSIINISSIAGLQASPRMSHYSAAKGGVRLFTKSAAIECASLGYNIRVNSVHPGVIDTAIWRNPEMVESYRAMMPRRPIVTDDEAGARIDPAALAALVTPDQRLGQPRDIAEGVVFLASDESRYMNGAELVIDGGATAA